MSTWLVVLAQAGLHREAWRALLSAQPGIAVAGGITGAPDLARLGVSQPAAVLIDLPDPSPELVRQLKAAAPAAGLLLLVPALDLPAILPLLQAGAAGFVSRDAAVGDLSRAIIAVGRGELVLPPTLAAQALVALTRGLAPAPEPSEALSEREAEIVRLLAQGLTNKDIAQTLILSVRTVEAHLRSVFAKLGVRSRTEAALWAVRHGYGPPV